MARPREMTKPMNLLQFQLVDRILAHIPGHGIPVPDGTNLGEK